MPLNNTELYYYDINVLKLPADKRKEYHEQVDRLITELSKSVREKTEIKITKVVKAGSFAKYTILRKTSTDPVDVDVVFYISGRSVDHETLQGLNDTIYNLLISIYPTKDVEDFQIQRKAATVSFVGTGISVDVVPVIEDPKGRRAILIIDEGDSLAATRSQEHSHHEDKVAVNTLIQGIDDLRRFGGRVVTFLCTNRMSVVDPALIRRAAIIEEFKRPGPDERKQLFQMDLGALHLTDAQLGHLVTATEGRNGQAPARLCCAPSKQRPCRLRRRAKLLRHPRPADH
jgi:hypothetical protein